MITVKVEQLWAATGHLRAIAGSKTKASNPDAWKAVFKVRALLKDAQATLETVDEERRALIERENQRQEEARTEAGAEAIKSALDESLSAIGPSEVTLNVDRLPGAYLLALEVNPSVAMIESLAWAFDFESMELGPDE